MMIIIFIELCRIADSLLWIPKSSRRTSSIFYIPNIIALLKMESQQLSQNSPTLHSFRCSLKAQFAPLRFAEGRTMRNITL
ncbi:HLJ1_G0043530.mRNA.1.CDS.1 [Saccharomyces cerevisiae]|nr:HLJ1_G0043530.mRNA.1.CDS.1 [Saccharomyces cerevisiae]